MRFKRLKNLLAVTLSAAMVMTSFAVPTMAAEQRPDFEDPAVIEIDKEASEATYDATETFEVNNGWFDADTAVIYSKAWASYELNASKTGLKDGKALSSVVVDDYTVSANHLDEGGKSVISVNSVTMGLEEFPCTEENDTVYVELSYYAGWDGWLDEDGDYMGKAVVAIKYNTEDPTPDPEPTVSFNIIKNVDNETMELIVDDKANAGDTVEYYLEDTNTDDYIEVAEFYAVNKTTGEDVELVSGFYGENWCSGTFVMPESDVEIVVTTYDYTEGSTIDGRKIAFTDVETWSDFNNSLGKIQLSASPKLDTRNHKVKMAYNTSFKKFAATYVYKQNGKGKALKQKLVYGQDYRYTFTEVKAPTATANGSAKLRVYGINGFVGHIDYDVELTKASGKLAVYMPETVVVNSLYKKGALSENAVKAFIDDTWYSAEVNGEDIVSDNLLITAKAGAAKNGKQTLSVTFKYTGAAYKVKKAVTKKVTLYDQTDSKIKVISSDDIKVELKNPNKTYTFNGKAQKAAVKVTVSGQTLSPKKYSVVYNNNVDSAVKSGKADVVVKLKNEMLVNDNGWVSNQIYAFDLFAVDQVVKAPSIKFSAKYVAPSVLTPVSINDIDDVAQYIQTTAKVGKAVLDSDDYTVSINTLELSAKDAKKYAAGYEVKFIPTGKGNISTNLLDKKGKKAAEVKPVKIKIAKKSIANKAATAAFIDGQLISANCTLTSGNVVFAEENNKPAEIKTVTLSYNGVSVNAVSATISAKDAKKVKANLAKATPATTKVTIIIKTDDPQYTGTIKIKAVVDPEAKVVKTWKKASLLDLVKKLLKL